MTLLIWILGGYHKEEGETGVLSAKLNFYVTGEQLIMLSIPK